MTREGNLRAALAGANRCPPQFMGQTTSRK
jgi:hypothetical protein